jgi:hypothetical protein
MMNHRQGERVEISLPALIYSLGQPPLPGRVQDISLSGLGVILYQECNLQPMERVDVRLSLRLDTGPEPLPLSLPALVVRVEDDGVGLMLAREYPDLVRRVRGAPPMHQYAQDTSAPLQAGSPLAAVDRRRIRSAGPD